MQICAVVFSPYGRTDRGKRAILTRAYQGCDSGSYKRLAGNAIITPVDPDIVNILQIFTKLGRKFVPLQAKPPSHSLVSCGQQQIMADA